MDKKRQDGYLTRRERQAARHKTASIRNTTLIVGGIVFFAALFFMMFRSSTTAQSIVPPRHGASLGDFTLQDLNGATVRLSDYAGRPVLINSWASWCPPCRAEMPDLEAYYQAHKGEGFAVLALNAGEPKSTAASFAQNIGMTFPVLLDPGSGVLNAMEIRNFPTSILVGRDGTVKAIHIGLFTPEALEQEVTPYLAQ